MATMTQGMDMDIMPSWNCGLVFLRERWEERHFISMDDGGHSYGITIGRGKQEARSCRLPVLIPWTLQLRAMLLSGRLVPPQHLQQAENFPKLVGAVFSVLHDSTMKRK
ncbi:uncharacterized protein [Lolium perenne]|uniref:uncharacterized protein isoform X1 n=1 Tax=Lolium perenne TaxID=4522 RepID=UPI003A995833